MSRTRQKPNELDLWVFYQQTTDTDNHIDNDYNNIGAQFRAEDLGIKTRTERDVFSGRVKQGEAVQVYKTTIEIDLHIGDQISTIPNPNDHQKSTIVRITTKPQSKRGDRVNTTRIIEQTFEVS